MTISDINTNETLDTINLIGLRTWQTKDAFESENIKLTSNQTVNGTDGVVQLCYVEF